MSRSQKWFKKYKKLESEIEESKKKAEKISEEKKKLEEKLKIN